MSSATVYQAIRAWFDANWSATTVQWDNETFDKPAPTLHPANPAAFLVVEIEGGSYRQASIGSGSPSAERWAERGAVLVYCLVQAGASSLVARQHAETLATSFRGLILSGDIRFQAMNIGDGGPGDEDGNWWQILLRAEWLRG
jgi:hypothetical protein